MKAFNKKKKRKNYTKTKYPNLKFIKDFPPKILKDIVKAEFKEGKSITPISICPSGRISITRVFHDHYIYYPFKKIVGIKFFGLRKIQKRKVIKTPFGEYF